MAVFDWDPEKNRKLMEERGICFESALFYIMNGGLLDDLIHPNPGKYPNQRVMIVEIDEYAYLVPYLEEGETKFLKTIIPSRKATKIYLSDKSNEHN